MWIIRLLFWILGLLDRQGMTYYLKNLFTKILRILAYYLDLLFSLPFKNISIWPIRT